MTRPQPGHTPSEARTVATGNDVKGAGASTNAEEVVLPPPRSLPPVIPSLRPPPHAATQGSSVDMSAEHRWLADPRLRLLRGSVSDEHLVAIHRWGIDPSWTTNQIVGHMHAMLEKKVDRKIFETLLLKCQDTAALMALVYDTLSAQPPEVAERHARMRGAAR